MFRVAITTTADRSETLGDVVRRQGLEPVSLPCIEVSPAPREDLERARERAGGADWILLTSARAIDVLWPDGGMPGLPVAAVGSATADAVAAAGGDVVLAGDRDAGSLVDRMATRVGARRVFFPHASGADMATVGALEEAGARVEAVAVYRTRSVAPGPDPVDAVMFGSPSAVSGWLMGRSLEDLVVAAIGETTAEAVGAGGHRPDVVPPRPSFELLISHLGEFLRERSPV